EPSDVRLPRGASAPAPTKSPVQRTALDRAAAFALGAGNGRSIGVEGRSGHTGARGATARRSTDHRNLAGEQTSTCRRDQLASLGRGCARTWSAGGHGVQLLRDPSRALEHGASGRLGLLREGTGELI